MKVLEVNPGFRVDKIVTMDVSLPWLDDPKAKTGQAIFFSNLIDRLKQIPGVRKVGATSGLPMGGGLPDGMFLLMTQNEIPKTMDGLVALFQQKERIGNADFCVATDTSRFSEFRWFEGESLTSATARILRTLP